MLNKPLIAICCMVTLPALVAGGAPATDAKAERAAAAAAEQASDWDAALRHYENVYDSTVCTPEEYVQLRRKFEELRPKVAPNTDPAKAAVYHVRTYAFRTIQVGERKNTYNDKQLMDVDKVNAVWADEVWKASHGQCRLDCKTTIIDEPLTKFSGVAGPEECTPYFKDLKPGEADLVSCYALSTGFDCNCWADTLGSVCKGAGYVGFNDNGDGGTCGNAEVQVHEWIHSLEMTIEWHHKYPDAVLPNSDSGGDCGPKCWQPKPGNDSLYDWYRHIMKLHLTRKMWRDMTLTHPGDSPWLADLKLCPQFAMLGPFDGTGKDQNGFATAFINEADPQPALGKQDAGQTWRKAERVGLFLNLAGVYYPMQRQVAYAAVLAKAPAAGAAQLRLGAASACKVWHNGKQIVNSPVARGYGLDQDKADVQLVQGDNLFVIKVVNSGAKDWSDWSVELRLTDAAGKPLDNIEYSVPAAAATK